MTGKGKAKAAARPDPDGAVLDAAARLFRQKGYPVITLRQIAREAGVFPGSIFYRYRTKEALLVRLMERAMKRMTAAIRRAVARADDPLQQVRIALRAHTRMLLSDDASIFVLLYDWRFLEPRTRESILRLRDEYEAFWDGLLRSAAGSTRVRRGVDLRLLRLLSFGAVNWVAQWYSPEGPSTPEQIADAFWDYLSNGVLDPGPPRLPAEKRRG
ncbi:MAG TPA: TetR/AcrR family transcriptional regulator [Myxococcales bacterium]|nr:TetR/AcrR family transcriptional regulator [Myxococcales bacterium]